MKPHSPSGVIKKSILPIVWWRAHWSGAGTTRCCNWRTSKNKPRNFSGKRLASLRPSRRLKCSRWQGICREYGMLPPRKPKTASGCCGCSLRILRSRSRADPKQLLVHIRWQGGACTDICVQLPPNIADRVRYPAAVVDRVRDLAQSLPDVDIADRLNQEGQVSALGKPLTTEDVQWIRYRYQIPSGHARTAGGTDCSTSGRALRSQPQRGLLLDRSRCHSRRAGLTPECRIGLHSTTQMNRSFRDWVRNSCRIQIGILNAIGGRCIMKPPSGCQAFAPRRPAWGFPPASPASVRRSRSAVVLASLANAVSGSRGVG